MPKHKRYPRYARERCYWVVLWHNRGPQAVKDVIDSVYKGQAVLNAHQQEWIKERARQHARLAEYRASVAVRMREAHNQAERMRRAAQAKERSKERKDPEHKGGGKGNYTLTIAAKSAPTRKRRSQDTLAADFDKGDQNLFRCSACKHVYTSVNAAQNHVDGGNPKGKVCQQKCAEVIKNE